MKHLFLFLTFVAAGFMVACDSGSGGKKATTDNTNNFRHPGNSNSVCTKLLPAAIAHQHPNYRINNHSSHRYNNNGRYNPTNNRHSHDRHSQPNAHASYGLDALRFYTPNGHFYIYRGDNLYVSQNGKRITCHRLHAIDDHFQYHRTCYQYTISTSTYQHYGHYDARARRHTGRQNHHTSNRHSQFTPMAVHTRSKAEYPIYNYGMDGTYSFYQSNNRLITCPMSTAYYDQFFWFASANSGEFYQHSRFYHHQSGRWMNPGFYSRSFLGAYFNFNLNLGYGIQFRF